MGGSVVAEDGNILLDWMEQSSPEPLLITSASATPGYLWPPNHSMVKIALDVTADESRCAGWYVEGVLSNQPEDGTGDGDTAPDWELDAGDPETLWLRAERSGEHPSEVREYVIILMATDAAGNLSDQYPLVVPEDHDQG